MIDLTLIERLEGLDGPCRETDAEIHLLLNPDDEVTIHRHEDTGDIAFIEVKYRCGGSDLDEISSYTASIDATLTLIPDGWEWEIEYNMISDYMAYQVHMGQPITVENISLPIAICIAALKARQTNTDNGE